jgi:hypothetical protein
MNPPSKDQIPAEVPKKEFESVLTALLQTPPEPKKKQQKGTDHK